MLYLGKFFHLDAEQLLENLKKQAGEHISSDAGSDDDPYDIRHNYANMVIYTAGPGVGRGRMEVWILLKSRSVL